MEGKGAITITTSLNQNNEVTLSIEDTGKGMNDEVLRRILEEGYSHGKDNGHGIGMMQVKETVREFNGKLDAQASAGKGSTLVINLPLSSPDIVPEISRAGSDFPLFSLAVALGEPIIVIDDDMSMLEQWRLVLENHEVKTITGDSYEDFLRQGLSPMISKTAIIDYHFENSELNGMEIVEKLQKQGFERLYICTAEYWKPQVQERARLLSCAICPKPLPEIAVYTIPQDVLEENGAARKRVLIVNDEDSQRLTLRLMLEEKEGFSIDEAKTLHEAKAKLMAHKRSIIISDVNLEDPHGDGFDLLRFSKARGHTGKFYLYSGFRKHTYTEQAKALGADGFYHVPLERDTLEIMLT
jgi:DNA-binding NtrC family response regulator